MKRITKLILIAILSLVMACGITGAVVLADTDKGSVTVTVATEYGVAGDTVDVTVTLSNNTGLGALSVFVDYDSNLTLDSVMFNNELGGNPIASNFKVTGSPVKLTWVTDGEYTGNGVFATLSFIVSSEATDGDFSELTLALDEAYDKDYNDVDVTLVDGGVILSGFPAGDVNHDKKVNTKDVRVLLQYIATGYDVTIDEILADVNSDGKLNTKDVRILLQYIAGGYGVTPISPKKINTVTFNGNGGTLVSGNEKQKVKYGESAVAPEYTRSGYIFDGFDADFSNVTKDLTVNAQWIENKQLSTPVISKIEYDTIYWEPVENADTYTIRINGDYTKELRGQPVENSTLLSCALQSFSADGIDIFGNKANKYGKVFVEIMANANGEWEKSDWSELDSSYIYVPSKTNDSVKAIYQNYKLGYGFNVNEEEYFKPSVDSNNIFNLDKLVSIGYIKQDNKSSEAKIYYYTGVDEFSSKTQINFEYGSTKSCFLLGSLKTQLNIDMGFDYSSYAYKETCECAYNITRNNYTLNFSGNSDGNYSSVELMVACLSEKFIKDITKTSTNTRNLNEEQFLEYLYSTYGTHVILGLTTGGTFNSTYTVATNNKDIAASIGAGFSMSIGGESPTSIIQNNWNLGIKLEEDLKWSASETKTAFEAKCYGGTGSGVVSKDNFNLTNWINSFSDGNGNEMPLELTKNGAVNLVTLIAYIDTDLANEYMDYIDERANELYYQLYDKYTAPLKYETNADGKSLSVVGIGACKSTDIVIPDLHNNLPVTAIKENAFKDNANITSVTIGNNVKDIGNYAFYGCSSLETVTLGKLIKYIGDKAFDACVLLKKIVYLGTVDDWVQINFGDSYNSNPLSNDNVCLYMDNDLLTTANITTATKINSYAFYNCSSLTSVTIPDSVMSIGKYAFYNCSLLTSVTIPNNVTSIGDYAFGYCRALTTIGIGNKLKTIDKNAFSNCNISKIIIDDIDNWVQIDGLSELTGVYYNAKIYKGDLEFTSITITTASKISSYAFAYRKNLTSIYLSPSVKSIEYGAFVNCDNLVSIYYGGDVNAWVQIEGLRYLLSRSFMMDSSKSNLYFNNQLISEVNITDTNKINDYAFYGCDSLTSVIIGNCVASIGISAFSGCDYLENIYYTGDINGWVQIEGLSNLMQYGCTNIKLYINGKLLKDINITTATKIEDYAFRGCSSLTSVTIGNSVTSIGCFAFYNCISLTSATIGSGVISIGNYVFCGCSSLTSVSFIEYTDWYTTFSEIDWQKKTNGVAKDLSNSSTNATYFNSWNYWYRKK